MEDIRSLALPAAVIALWSILAIGTAVTFATPARARTAVPHHRMHLEETIIVTAPASPS